MPNDVLQAETSDAHMKGQWRGREWLGPTSGWVLVRCGSCAQRWRHQSAPVIGEAWGREEITGLKDLPVDLLLGDFEQDWTGAPNVPGPEDYEPFIASWRRHGFGPLRQITHGGPRVDAKAFEADVKARSPWLDEAQLAELVADELGGARTTESTVNNSYALVEETHGTSTLWCGRCQTTHQVGRRKLDQLVVHARQQAHSIHVTPGRGLTVGPPAAPSGSGPS